MRCYRSAMRLMVIAIALAASTGCATGYLLQAARGQVAVLAARRPIERVIADPSTSAALRTQLQAARAARRFASDELGLPDNRSYSGFADVQRPFVVWNVVAAPEFSLAARRWCFPIAGCVNYRGYFREAAARAYAARLRQAGNDVLVGGVSAYSTLGKFADPVLSSMLRYGDVEIAATIFHELAHQLVYIPGDSAFNEAFAVTVEAAGLVRWLAHVGQPAQLAVHKARRARQQTAIGLYRVAQSELRLLYINAPRTGAEQDAMRVQKRVILQRLESQLQVAGLRGNHEPSLNNADLVALATYWQCVPRLQKWLDAAGGELRAFYVAVREQTAARKKISSKESFCGPEP